MSKIATYVSLAVAALAISCACQKNCADGKSITLFNGQNLSGWRSHLADANVKMEQVWSVQDGILVCKGEPMGYLYTKDSFINYRLQVEYRWAPGQKPGNSGVFGRINGTPRDLPRCIETQLKNGSAGDLYGFHGLVIKGDPARSKVTPNHKLGGDIHAVSKITGNEKTPGEWNKVVVEAVGPRITVYLNDLKVNETTEADVVSGPVGLQSEGGEVHFRNVIITPLP